MEHLSDLVEVNTTDVSNFLPEQDIFIGDDTTALLLHLCENDGVVVEPFYENVIKFYQGFVKKQLKVFNFKSQVLQTLSFLNPCQSQHVSQFMFDQIADNIPIEYDKQVIKLEHREFVTDVDVAAVMDENAIKFWLNILHLKSPMGEPKYENLATLALRLLSIPTSNADSERAFSWVRRIKTEFRSSLTTDTVSALIGYHFNRTCKCCEVTKFEDSLLAKAKVCTHERNKTYGSS